MAVFIQLEIDGVMLDIEYVVNPSGNFDILDFSPVDEDHFLWPLIRYIKKSKQAMLDFGDIAFDESIDLLTQFTLTLESKIVAHESELLARAREKAQQDAADYEIDRRRDEQD